MLFFLTSLVTALISDRRSAAQSPSDDIHTEGVPAFPPGLTNVLRPYQFINANVEFQGWLGGGRQMLYLSTVTRAKLAKYSSGPALASNGS